MGQGETLFLGDEKLDLLGPEAVVAACWQAPTEAEKTTKKKKKKEQQKEPVPRVALVLRGLPLATSTVWGSANFSRLWVALNPVSSQLTMVSQQPVKFFDCPLCGVAVGCSD